MRCVPRFYCLVVATFAACCPSKPSSHQPSVEDACGAMSLEVAAPIELADRVRWQQLAGARVDLIQAVNQRAGAYMDVRSDCRRLKKDLSGLFEQRAADLKNITELVERTDGQFLRWASDRFPAHASQFVIECARSGTVEGGVWRTLMALLTIRGCVLLQ